MMDMYRKGLSISEIARQTGRDRKTVRQAVQGKNRPPSQKADDGQRASGKSTHLRVI